MKAQDDGPICLARDSMNLPSEGPSCGCNLGALDLAEDRSDGYASWAYDGHWIVRRVGSEIRNSKYKRSGPGIEPRSSLSHVHFPCHMCWVLTHEHDHSK